VRFKAKYFEIEHIKYPAGWPLAGRPLDETRCNIDSLRALDCAARSLRPTDDRPKAILPGILYARKLKRHKKSRKPDLVFVMK
jgi:hypothetical protein